MQAIQYFPGANTPQGFYSYYADILPPQDAKRRIILKGGPGTGKSSLMRKVASLFEAHGYEAELLHCSSDPDSLDGIVIRKLGFCMLDGTAPHITDPTFPAAIDQIINLGEYWDNDKIAAHRSEIESVSAAVSAGFTGAYAYLRAAAGVQDYIALTMTQTMQTHKLTSQAESIVAELKLHGQGRIQKGFISALTPKGQIDFTETFLKRANRLIVVHAESNLASVFFNAVADKIRHCSAPARFFYCPMYPQSKLEHIYLPTDGTFITTSNTYHQTQSQAQAEHIDFNRFVSPSPALRADTDLLNLLLSRAIACLRTAKENHDKLEAFYIPYMDFEKMQTLPNKIVEEIL